MRLSDFFWRTRRGRAIAPVAAPISGADELDDQNYERMILGMMVEYPDVVNQNLERLEQVELETQAHRIFLDALITLYQSGAISGVTNIYENLPNEFYFVLNQVHGAENGPQKRGHRFYARFPLALRWPPHAIVERSLLHFLDGLYVINLEKEKKQLAEELAAAFIDSNSLLNEEEILNKIQQYSKLLDELREKIMTEEHEILSLLSEFFSNIRKLAA